MFTQGITSRSIQKPESADKKYRWIIWKFHLVNTHKISRFERLVLLCFLFVLAGIPPLQTLIFHINNY